MGRFSHSFAVKTAKLIVNITGFLFWEPVLKLKKNIPWVFYLGVFIYNVINYLYPKHGQGVFEFPDRLGFRKYIKFRFRDQS